MAVGIELGLNVALVHALGGQEKQRKDMGSRSAIFGVSHSAVFLCHEDTELRRDQGSQAKGAVKELTFGR